MKGSGLHVFLQEMLSLWILMSLVLGRCCWFTVESPRLSVSERPAPFPLHSLSSTYDVPCETLKGPTNPSWKEKKKNQTALQNGESAAVFHPWTCPFIRDTGDEISCLLLLLDGRPAEMITPAVSLIKTSPISRRICPGHCTLIELSWMN